MRRCLAFLLIIAGILFPAAAQDFVEAGPLIHQFRLTLEPGEGAQYLGPLVTTKHSETNSLWAIAPLAAHYEEPEIEHEEFDFLYPFITYDRFGTEWQAQVMQLINFHGGVTQDGEVKRRRNFFPIFFSQTSTNPTNNYWSLLPIYGHFRNHLFRDEVKFVAAPLYVWSRKGQMETDNYLFPFFHVRHGGGIKGWQFFPVVGHETKTTSVRTNMFTDEPEVIPGYDKWFALWPFFHHENLNLGTTNEEKRRSFLLLYSFQRSPARDNSTIFWPFFSYTDDRENKFHEWGMPYPFIGWARGEGKHANRFWPFWGKATNASITSDFTMWPVYTHRHINTPEVDRERMRILWFAYSDSRLTSPITGVERRRRDMWPLFTWRKEFDGRESLKMLSLTEPLIPDNHGVERSWAPLWTIYSNEKNPKTGASSQSLLWNLWRHDQLKASSRDSFLFGLVRTRREKDERHWRFFWLPFPEAAKAAPATNAPAAGQVIFNPPLHRGDAFFNPQPVRSEVAER